MIEKLNEIENDKEDIEEYKNMLKHIKFLDPAIADALPTQVELV